MKAVRINKNFYEFFETKEINGQQIEQSIGFDSYTTTIQHVEDMSNKLIILNDRLLAMEQLGMTDDDLNNEESI